MKQKAGLWFLLGLVLSAQALAAFSPERDIVSVISAKPISNAENMPGLLDGQRAMDALQEGLEIVRSGVAAAVLPGLDTLAQDLQATAAGQSSDGTGSTPDWMAGQTWLPVKAEELQVKLDAPDLHRRSIAGGPGGRVDDLSALARRAPTGYR